MRLRALTSAVPPKQEGFALVAALLIVGIMSVAAIPLLGLVDTTKQGNVKGQVTSFLNVEARENLELAVYIAKSAGGMPGYFNSTHTPTSRSLAQSCENRIGAADPGLLGDGNSLANLNNAVYSTVSTINGRQAITFVVDKGTAASQDDNGDDRYHRYLVASCAIADNFGMALYTSEIANIQGSFYTLNLNEY